MTEVKKVQKFHGKPVFSMGSGGYICFSGVKLIKEVWVAGYFFRFWGSKTWRFIPLKMIKFLSLNYIEGVDYGIV